MIRRCPAPLIVLAAALGLGLGSRPTSSRADVTPPTFTAYNVSSLTSQDISQWTVNPGIQIKYDGTVSDPSPGNDPAGTWLKYTLTTTQAIASAGATPPGDAATKPPTPQVLALDTPISIVSPSGGGANALDVVSDSPQHYYDVNNNWQKIVVGIGTSTLQDGSSPVQVQALGLTFYGQGLQAGESIQFELPFDPKVVGNPSSTGTTVGQQGGVGQGGGTPQSSETPEPLSLLVWSALAGAGIYRARARARRRAPGA